jgi:hypothetical protein
MEYDYKARVFGGANSGRYVLAYKSKVSNEWIYLTLEARNSDDARWEAARLLDIDIKNVGGDVSP